MLIVLKSLVYATLWASLALILGLIPGVQMFVWLAAMVVLIMLDSAGVTGLGHPSQGFFIPNDHGMFVALLSFWIFCFIVSCAVMGLTRLWRGPPAPWWQKQR